MQWKITLEMHLEHTEARNATFSTLLVFTPAWIMLTMLYFTTCNQNMPCTLLSISCHAYLPHNTPCIIFIADLAWCLGLSANWLKRTFSLPPSFRKTSMTTKILSHHFMVQHFLVFVCAVFFYSRYPPSLLQKAWLFFKPNLMSSIFNLVFCNH